MSYTSLTRALDVRLLKVVYLSHAFSLHAYIHYTYTLAVTKWAWGFPGLTISLPAVTAALHRAIRMRTHMVCLVHTHLITLYHHIDLYLRSLAVTKRKGGFPGLIISLPAVIAFPH